MMARSVRCSVLVCLLVSLAAAGCATVSSVHEAPSGWLYPYANMPTAAEFGDDHAQRIARILALDRRLLAEDFDLVFLTERSTRLSRWHDR